MVLLSISDAQLRPTLCDPMDCSLPGTSVHGIYRQEYWSGLPFPSPGIFQTQGSNPYPLLLLHCRQTLYYLSHLGLCKMVITLYYMEDACHEMTATITVENDNGLWLGKNWGNMHFLFPDINSLLLVFHPSFIMAIIKLRLSPARKHFKRKKKYLPWFLTFL